MARRRHQLRLCILHILQWEACRIERNGDDSPDPLLLNFLGVGLQDVFERKKSFKKLVTSQKIRQPRVIHVTRPFLEGSIGYVKAREGPLEKKDLHGL